MKNRWALINMAYGDGLHLQVPKLRRTFVPGKKQSNRELLYMLNVLSIEDAITTSLFGVHILVQSVAAAVMFAKHRKQNDRSRLFIALFFLTSAVAALGEVIIALCDPDYADGFLLLDPKIILCGFVIFFLLLLYPVEVLRPNWLNGTRVLRMLFPWLFLSATLIVWQFLNVRPLHSVQDVFTYIGEPNVWLRVLLTFIYIPYGIWLLVMQHNWRNSSAPLPWIRAVVCITLCMTITYFMGQGLRIFWANTMHEVLYLVVTALILYIELAIRLRVPDNQVSATYIPLVVELDFPQEAAQNIATEEETSAVITGVANRIAMAMDDPDVWQNPELSQADLIKLVGTNRRYCQLAIHALGYNSYPEMINSRRVEYIQDSLRANPGQNIQNLFYEAGYRSRTSAWRNFTAITGCSPSDFTAAEKETEDAG